jgi:ferrochelatase
MPDRAVLLVNLGSPDTPTEPDVRRYLEQFLMDPRVVDLPWPLRRFIVSAFILPSRPKRSAEAYASIWTEAGSPLKVTTAELAEALDARLQQPVRWAMRYGEPSIEDALLGLAREGVTTVRYVPLYPHWAMSTTETSVVEAERVIAAHGLDLTLEVQPPFYDDPDYIAELVGTAREVLEPDDHLLFSYHGLPERQIRKCDPTDTHCLKRPDCCRVESPAHATCYRHQVYVTSELIAASLGLATNQWEVAFQSRVGRAKWIEPYTDRVLAELPQRGIRRIAVMCPAFVADNLETLEEIGIEGRETFLEAGGERYKLIPCLNARPGWVDVLAGWFLGEDDADAVRVVNMGAASGA